MKKTFYLLTILSLFTFSTVQSQEFGVRLGLNSTNFNFEIDDQEFDTDGQINLALGVFLNLPVGTNAFSIQPELTYLSRGYGVEEDLGVLGNFDQKVNFGYLDIGALAKLNFGSADGLGFYAGVGPFFGYALSGSVEVNGDKTDIDFDDNDDFRRGVLQYALAGGLTYNAGIKLFAEVRYMNAISDLEEGDDVTFRPNSIGLHAGVMVPIGG